MTTNKPESLDEALTRPGHVDVQVAFNNATPKQAMELFYRMYKGSQLEPEKVGIAEGETKRTVAVIQAEELSLLSGDFGRLIPEGMFSPTEIQGFLLERKKSPHKAVADATGWIEVSM
ncbi:hypothetical protein NW759_016847 [Fusarium solani]|nr:hypothetical protein NW759_016847 [Fusarium solani]